MEDATDTWNSVATPRGPALAPRVLLWLAASLAGLIFVVDLLTPLGVADGMLYAAVIVAMPSRGRLSWVVLAAFGCTILILGGYALSPEGEVPEWTSLLNRGMSLLIVWVLAIALIARSGQEEEGEGALQACESPFSRVRVLRGIVPICASCKKIHDPEGRWHRLEAYIQDHSEAEFSHGLCDACLAVVMPKGPA